MIVVEDTLVREALRSLLHTWGYQVTETGHYQTGRSGEVSVPDLILFDIEDPDGHALLKLIGSVSEGMRRNAPLLILSNDASGGHVRALRQSGMDLHAINKPVRPDHLHNEIRSLLGLVTNFA